VQFFANVKLMLTTLGAGIHVGLPVCIVALLANGHIFGSDKRVYEKRMIGIGVP
jgi:hypothetical protein